MELRAGMELMANEIAVRLNSLAEVVGDKEWWWVTLLFVEPSIELREFDIHVTYSSLHSAKKKVV